MLGSDPEVFAWDAKHKKVVPAYFALGGDIDLELPFGKAYPDGAAIEFTVTPHDSGFVMAERIQANLAAIQQYIGDTQGLQISLVSNADVGEFIPQLGEEYGTRASLQILGCTKDMSVYEKSGWVSARNRPDPKTYPYRTIGTHIHIGVPDDLIDNWIFVQLATSYLDGYLGTAYTYMYARDLPSRARMNLYGGAGTIRVKREADDGYNAIEYRVLPSISVLHSQDTAGRFFDAAQKLMDRAVLKWREGYALQHSEDPKMKSATAARHMLDDLGGKNLVQSMVCSIQTYNAHASENYFHLYADRYKLGCDILNTAKYNHLWEAA